MRLDKNDPQVWYNLAGVYVNKNNYNKALEMVNNAISLQSNYPEAIATAEAITTGYEIENPIPIFSGLGFDIKVTNLKITSTVTSSLSD